MWARIATAALGIWLMASPEVLRYGPPARTNDYIVGPIAAAFAIIAIWQVTRPLRWVDFALGAWLLIGPFLLGYPVTPLVNSVVVGLAMMALSLDRGKVTDRTGGGWSALWKSPDSAEH